jgi:hypothetical protein
VLKRTGHASDFCSTRADLPRSLPPSRCHYGHLFDDDARRREAETKIPRSRFKQVDGAGAFVKINVGRKHARFQVSWYRIEVIGWGKRLTRLAEPQEAMIAQMILDIRDQHVESDATIKRLGVCLRLGAMLRDRVDDFGIAASLAVLGSRHGHRGEERDANSALPIESSRQEHRLAADLQQFM